jgi:signal transduction histidine kinase
VISDILTMVRINARGANLHLAELDLARLTRECVVAGKEAADAAGVDISVQASDEVRVFADEKATLRIINELLSNAIEFTPKGGHISLAVSATDDTATVRVTDSGDGVEPADQARIFLPFTQVDSSLSRQHGGTGMGLALTGKLAELQGGRIQVKSDGKGKGSTFSLELPLGSKEDEAAR